MNKKSLLIVVLVVLALVAGVGYFVVSGPSTSRKPQKALTSKPKPNKKSLIAAKKARNQEKVAETETKREKPVLLQVDDDDDLSEEMKGLIAILQEALDREDRRGVSKLAGRIQEMIAKDGQGAVPVSVRMKAVEALSWFLPDTLADLVPFMSDSSPEVVDDVMSACEDALDNSDLGDRELSQIVKSLAKAISDDDALDSLFFCVESDMRNSVAVETYKDIMNNGSQACKGRVLESIADFTGEDNIKSEADLDNWLKENPDDEDDEDFYAGEKEDE